MMMWGDLDHDKSVRWHSDLCGEISKIGGRLRGALIANVDRHRREIP